MFAWLTTIPGNLAVVEVSFVNVFSWAWVHRKLACRKVFLLPREASKCSQQPVLGFSGLDCF